MAHKFECLTKIMDSIFGPPQPVVDPMAAFEAQSLAREEEILQSEIAYAKRLRPFAGRLLLVSDCGPSFAPDYQREGALRIAEAVSSDVFSPDTPLGLSIHLTHKRQEHGQTWQKETADLLTEALRTKGFRDILLPQTHTDSIDFWLRTITVATEITAKVYDAEPAQIGHIAVVAATDLSAVGIKPEYTNGEAFVLLGTDDTPKFTWQSIFEPTPYA